MKSLGCLWGCKSAKAMVLKRRSPIRKVEIKSANAVTPPQASQWNINGGVPVRKGLRAYIPYILRVRTTSQISQAGVDSLSITTCWGNVEATAPSAMIIRSSSRIGRNLALRLNIGNLSDDTDAIYLPHLYFIR